MPSRILCLAGLAFAAGCATPATQFSGLSPEVIRAEQLRQQQLVITSSLREQQRLADLATPLLRAAVPLCGDRVGPRSGVLVANVHSWTREYQPAARALGFSDTLRVVGVAAGSAAARGGVKVGDRIVAVDDRAAPVGRTAVDDFVALVSGTGTRASARLRPAPRTSLRLGLVAGDSASPSVAVQALEVPLDTVCAFGAVAQKDDALNAYADGRSIYITTAMMRFAASDAELAVVVAHEIAHNAMRHVDAMKRNSGLGAFLGAVVDIAAASQGVNTGGDFTAIGADAGATAFSQDFEREADYVGLFILARAGHDVSGAADFWRRMAQESPGSIKYASTHPTTAERFIRLEQAANEIAAKRAAGDELMPTLTRQPPR